MLFNGDAKNPRGFNLYQLFDEVVCFEVVQRQQGDDQALFRKELQSLGDGEFSRESWSRWRSRTLDLLSPEEQEDFKQKTAYEIGVRLVGSEMCIRDRSWTSTCSNFLLRIPHLPDSGALCETRPGHHPAGVEQPQNTPLRQRAGTG